MKQQWRRSDAEQRQKDWGISGHGRLKPRWGKGGVFVCGGCGQEPDVRKGIKKKKECIVKVPPRGEV